jgi:hypothetical protein
MVIERTEKEIFIRLPKSFDTDELQDLLDFLLVQKIVSKSKAKPKDASQLAKEINESWWSKNKNRFLNEGEDNR